MLAELYNNPSLIIAIVIFLICVIIGFVGDLYLKKVKKEEEAKNRAENTKIANEEQIETLDTEPVQEPIVNNIADQFVAVAPVEPVQEFNTFAPPVMENVNNVAFEAPIMDSVNNMTFETPVANNTTPEMNTAFEQPIMPTNINSDYNVSMSYEEPVQSFSGYETPFVEPINNTGIEMQNINNSEFNSYNTMSNDFATPTVDYVQPVQNLDETQILDSMNNYAYEVPNTNTFNQTNNFTDNNLNNSNNFTDNNLNNSNNNNLF